MKKFRKKVLEIFSSSCSLCVPCVLCASQFENPRIESPIIELTEKYRRGSRCKMPGTPWLLSPSQSSVYLKLWCSHDVRNAFSQSFALLVAGTVSQQWTQIVHDSSFSKPLLMSVQLHLSLIFSVTLNARKTWTQLETFSKRNFAVCSTDSVPEFLLTGRHIYIFS